MKYARDTIIRHPVKSGCVRHSMDFAKAGNVLIKGPARGIDVNAQGDTDSTRS